MVLDYEMKYKSCFECKAGSKWDKNSELGITSMTVNVR